MPKKTKNKTILAVCVQETVEDGSEMQLGEEFTSEDTFFLHQAFLADTIVNCLAIKSFDIHLFYGSSTGTKKAVSTIIAYLKDRLKGPLAKGLEERFNFTILDQDRWGLKMDRAFKTCFFDGYKQVLFVGSRTPTLGKKMLKLADKMLSQSDAVFGPTVQGRYYLIGMSGRYHVDLSKFDWRSPKIYSEVTDKFREKNLSWSEMEMWYAIEHPEDLEFLIRDINQYRLEGDELSARETELALKRVMERQE